MSKQKKRSKPEQSEQSEKLACVLKHMRQYFGRFTHVSRLPIDAAKTVLAPFVQDVVHAVATDHNEYVRKRLMEMSPHKTTIAACAADYDRTTLLAAIKHFADFLRNPGLDDNRKSLIGFKHYLPSALSVVGSPRTWAPSFTNAGTVYIPTLYAAGATAIKKMMAKVREAIRKYLVQLITNKFEQGWLPAFFVADAHSAFTYRLNSHGYDNSVERKKFEHEYGDGSFVNQMMPVACEQASFVKNQGSVNSTMTFVRDVPDSMPGEQKGVVRAHVMHHQNIKWAIHEEKGELTVSVSGDDYETVILDGVTVDYNDYMVHDWSLAAINHKVPNVEQRRVLLRRYGIGRLITPQNSKTLDIDVAAVHVDEPDAPSITRALISVTEEFEKRPSTIHIVVGWDGSTDRVYYMPASTTERGQPRHYNTLAEWDAAVGQPKRLYAQA